MSVNVSFITATGERVEATGEVGAPLLALAQSAGMPLEGTCEGQMACSTCHVIVAQEWFSRLPQAIEEEEDMLDLAAAVQPTSRLSCQILLDPSLNGLEVIIPGNSQDMSKY